MHDDLPNRAAGASEARFRLPRGGGRGLLARGVSPLCWLAVAVLVSMSAGCSISRTVRALCGPYEEYKRRGALKLGAEMEARRIWTECYAEDYQERPGERDFKQGFVTAFVETTLGRTGCPPPVPTSPLISGNTLSHSFPDANFWYAGYQLGHVSALANGMDRQRLAPVNPELLAQARRHHSGSHWVEPEEEMEALESPAGVPEEELRTRPEPVPEDALLPPDRSNAPEGASAPQGAAPRESFPSPRPIE